LPRSHVDTAPFRFKEGDLESFVAALASRVNQLEVAACALHPEISHVLAYLRARRGCMLARMSGSGATCFGLFAGADDARRAVDEVANDEPDWWAVSAALEPCRAGGDCS
jgi:4-diphosphocytidyl-2-C-methyl-D-erythritol kinase